MPDVATARCDFPGGDAHILYQSVQKLFKLPPETRLFLCHDYPPSGREATWQTTVVDERKNKLQINDSISEVQFVEKRSYIKGFPSFNNNFQAASVTLELSWQNR